LDFSELKKEKATDEEDIYGKQIGVYKKIIEGVKS
jgi:hypothetical protein